jgi:transcriptional regulator with XRE-family HTH domain
MNNIILEIKNAIEKQGVTARQAAINAGIPVNTVSRILAGVTKKPDIEVLRKLQEVLGIISSSGDNNSSNGMLRQVTTDEYELLRYYRQLCPQQKESAMQMVRGLLLLSQKSEKNEKPGEDYRELKSA